MTLLHLNSNLGHILPHFRDIGAFVHRYPFIIPVKISGCSLWK